MKSAYQIVAVVALFAVFQAGCSNSPQETPSTKAPSTSQVDKDAAEREAAFAELSSEDRELAEEQGYCAVTSEPLGSMGPPLKLLVNDTVAFVCCKGCEKKALSNPEKTLAKVAELQAKVKSNRGD